MLLGFCFSWNILTGKPEAIFGLHVAPAPMGTFLFRSGGMMASGDKFRIVVKGKGTHGAMPCPQTNLTVTPAVVTIGMIKGGNRSNIKREIPKGAIEAGADLVFLVASHARSGSPGGFFPHTFFGGFSEVRINGNHRGDAFPYHPGQEMDFTEGPAGCPVLGWIAVAGAGTAEPGWRICPPGA